MVCMDRTKEEVTYTQPFKSGKQYGGGTIKKSSLIGSLIFHSLRWVRSRDAALKGRRVAAARFYVAHTQQGHAIGMHYECGSGEE